jgi:hypothetical protein
MSGPLLRVWSGHPGADEGRSTCTRPLDASQMGNAGTGREPGGARPAPELRSHSV